MRRLFGTFGVRGISNELMTPKFAYELCLAFSNYLKGGKVVIGIDTRTSSEMLKAGAVAGLLAGGSDVIDLGTVPTPTVQFACKYYNATGGVVITASHNPREWNGIKLLEPEGLGLQRENDEKVEKIFFSKKFKLAKKPGKVWQENILPVYAQEMLKMIDIKTIKKRKIKILLDAASGSACFLAPYVLGKLGKLITINTQQDGFFPGRKPEPILENLEKLCKMVKAVKADIGIAMDGDGDRCVAVDENGKIVWGDKSFAIIAKDILKKKKGLVVSSIALSNVVKETVEKYGGRFQSTRVGELVIAKVLLEKKGMLGGEENGGLIFPNFTLGREGTLTAGKLIEVMVKGKPLSKLVKDLPEFYQTKTRIPIKGDSEKIMRKIKRKVRGKIDYTDGVKIIFKNSWVLMRPSGTEPIIRVFTEGKTKERAEGLKKEYTELVTSLL